MMMMMMIDTHRRLRVAQEAPVYLGEPLVLLHLGGTALAAQPGRFPLIEQTRDDVFAGPGIAQG